MMSQVDNTRPGHAQTSQLIQLQRRASRQRTAGRRPHSAIIEHLVARGQRSQRNRLSARLLRAQTIQINSGRSQLLRRGVPIQLLSLRRRQLLLLQLQLLQLLHLLLLSLLLLHLRNGRSRGRALPRLRQHVPLPRLRRRVIRGWSLGLR